MFQPLTCAPLTVQGVGVLRAGDAPQTSTTFPLTAPPAEALLSRMLPFDHTSPVTWVVELPWKVNDAAVPLQLPGLRVWIAAPLVPVPRASAVAVAPIAIVGPEPSTCIIVTPTWWVAVALNVTPAIEWSTADSVRTWFVSSPYEHESVSAVAVHAGAMYSRSLL